jgi:hypothetical protein
MSDWRGMGSDHLRVGHVLLDVALNRSELGDHEALARASAWPGHAEHWARLRFCAARAEWDRGHEARARVLAREAWALYGQDAGANEGEIAALDQWMARTGTSWLAD